MKNAIINLFVSSLIVLPFMLLAHMPVAHAQTAREWAHENVLNSATERLTGTLGEVVGNRVKTAEYTEYEDGSYRIVVIIKSDSPHSFKPALRDTRQYLHANGADTKTIRQFQGGKVWQLELHGCFTDSICNLD